MGNCATEMRTFRVLFRSVSFFALPNSPIMQNTKGDEGRFFFHVIYHWTAASAVGTAGASSFCYCVRSVSNAKINNNKKDLRRRRRNCTNDPQRLASGAMTKITTCCAARDILHLFLDLYLCNIQDKWIESSSHSIFARPWAPCRRVNKKRKQK